MKSIKFNNSTYRALSNICNAAGQVAFGTFVAGLVILPLDVRKALVLILELAFVILFWYSSIKFAEKGKL